MHSSSENPSSFMACLASLSGEGGSAFELGIRLPQEVGESRGRPLQPTWPLILRMKFGHAKHCTKETFFFRTGQATASFFILAICFPPATPFRSWTYCLGVGVGFSGVKIST